MISYKEAQDIIENEFNKFQLETEQVSLLDSLNRVLAEDIISDIEQPPFDNSAMDGIAIKFNPEIKSWNIIGEIAAGNYHNFDIDENTCVRIMTGGKIPTNADTVIPIEDIDDDEKMASLNSDAKVMSHQHLRYKGENMAKGNVAVYKNTLIQPQNIALIAGCGKENFQVYKQFKIGVLATGDELVEVKVKPPEDKIRATNIYALLSEIKNINQIPLSYGFIGDDKDLIKQKIKEILHSDIDILLTSGGVSVGKYDYLKEILEENGLHTKFWRVYIKPGKPLLFGVYEKNGRKKFVFGLPGNPVSSYITFLIFVKSNIEKIFNISGFETVIAELDSELRKNDAKRHFPRGFLRYMKEEAKYFVKQTASSSGSIVSLSDANCLIVVPEERTNPRKGERIECIKI